MTAAPVLTQTTVSTVLTFSNTMNGTFTNSTGSPITTSGGVVLQPGQSATITNGVVTVNPQ